MSRPWMPLFIADYKADTGHLGALEHGAYLMLMMHYWQTGGLPEDDRQLARISCTTPGEWKQIRTVLMKLFQIDGSCWKHKRIDKELAKSAQITSKRSDAAFQMHSERAANAQASADANGHAEHDTLQPQPPSQPNKILDFKRVATKSGRSPPPHGAKGKGRVYLQRGTEEWSAYAEDFKSFHGYEPTANQHGGKWFKLQGEAS